MEMKVENVIMNVDSINAWAIKDIGFLYCDLFNQISEISNSSIRNEVIEEWLTYLITCVQKLGTYSGVICNHFCAEKIQLETRVNRIIIRIVSLYARDFKNINLFLGVLLDGILSLENAIERHKFIIKTMNDTRSYFEPAKINLLVNHSNRSMKKIAQ
jgi:hypothetical protein